MIKTYGIPCDECGLSQHGFQDEDGLNLCTGCHNAQPEDEGDAGFPDDDDGDE